MKVDYRIIPGIIGLYHRISNLSLISELLKNDINIKLIIDIGQNYRHFDNKFYKQNACLAMRSPLIKYLFLVQVYGRPII